MDYVAGWEAKPRRKKLKSTRSQRRMVYPLPCPMAHSERPQCCWCPSVCVFCTNKMSALYARRRVRRRCRRRHRSSVMIPIYRCFIAWDVAEWKTADRQKRHAIAALWCAYVVNERRRCWFQLRVIEQSVCSTSIDLRRFDNFCQCVFLRFDNIIRNACSEPWNRI